MKKNLFRFALLSVLAVMSFWSCEKDDICAENTPTTPLLILRFYDIADNDALKPVSSLFAYAIEDDDSLIPILGINEGNSDSLAIPLRTDQTTTRIALFRDHSVDENNNVFGNRETLSLNYSPEDVYVSRACGFKTVFKGLLLNVEQDGDNWILNSEVVINDVESQNQAHVQVFH